MKEKSLEKHQKKEFVGGVSIDFLEKLEPENEKNREDLREVIESLKEKLISYKKLVNNMEKAINISGFVSEEDKYVNNATNYDTDRKQRHNVIIDLLNIISRLSKNRKWRESWGAINSKEERENIFEWAMNMADLLESSSKNEKE